MNKRFFLILLVLFTFNKINSQKLPNIDTIYDSEIRTVQILANGQFREMPIIDIKNGGFTLSFDDMNRDLRNYIYTVEYCDRDWNPSKLEKIEYLEGLQEDRITNFKNSSSTNISYVHYRFSIPNDVIRFSKSGNYVVHVFEGDGDDKIPILTRRFMVVEPILIISSEFAIPNALFFNSHHELDFKLDPKNFRISNPMNDIRVSIIQNGRWDNARLSVPPTYVQGEKIVYDYQDSLRFPAGKEWRFVDLRSTRFRSLQVASIDKGDETWDFTLRTDLDRSREPYLVYPDINGSFYIENNDFREANSDYEADYVNAFFTLKKEEIEDADVYIFGKLSDWKIDQRFKMSYNEKKGKYEADILLKQGFYNYNYIVVPHGSKSFDISTLEGNWYEAENEYTILVYYRPFGARQDRIIGFQKLKSSRR